MGPKPRKYNQRTPKKMIRLALASALSDRAADGKVRILDDFAISAPKTKDAIALLAKIDVWGKILIVGGHEDAAAAKSFANLVGVQTITHDQLNTYDVLANDFLVFTKASFDATCAARPAPAERKAARIAHMSASATSAMADVMVDDAIAEERATSDAGDKQSNDDHAEDAPTANQESAEQPERSEAAIVEEEE